MKHPMLIIVGCEEFRNPELEQALQLKGWDVKWLNGATNGSDSLQEGMEPTALIVNSGLLDDSIQLIRDFRSKNSLIPLILIGENAMGFPMNVDASIPRGAAPDVWLTELNPFWPEVSAPEAQQGQEHEAEEFGKYKLIRKIASGGTADIFQAEQFKPDGFNRILAIKRLLPKHQQNPTYIKMLFDEANLLARLENQNIVRVIDVGSEAGTHYLAMEYVDGGNLRSLINNAKELSITFPEPIAAFIIAKVATALDYAHRRRDGDGQPMNLVHRDISPQNILVNQEGEIKVIDFGIAKAVTLPSEQTNEDVLQGKLLYMSPEQSLGTPTDHRSDIYSLGLVLFELLTTEPCFKADSNLGLLEKVRAGLTRDIRETKLGTSKPMTRILDKALQKNISSRYSSAQTLANDLTAFLAHLKLTSLESDVGAFIKMLHDVQPQTKAFVASRFSPVRGNFTLPSEKEKEKAKVEDAQNAKKEVRPVWILPTINALMILLAYMLWLSMNF